MSRVLWFRSIPSTCVALFLAAAVAWSGPAAAVDYDIWLPYLRAHYHGYVAPFGSGSSGNDSLYNLPDFVDPNLHWSSTNVATGYAGRSYFDQLSSKKSWRIMIHNKKTTSRSVSLKLRRATDGTTVVKGTTKFLYALGGDSANYLCKGTPTGGLTWDGTNNEWDITVAAESTALILMTDVYNTPALHDYFPATAQIVVKSATDTSDVVAYVDGIDVYKPRANANNEDPFIFLDPIQIAQWGYQGVLKPTTPGSNQTTKLVFPYFQEIYVKSLEPDVVYTNQSESFQVFLTTTATSSDLLVKAWQKNGSGLYGEHYDTVSKGQEISFLADQLLWSGSGGADDGYIEVYGAEVIAVGFRVRYSDTGMRTGSTTPTYKTFQAPNWLNVMPTTETISCCGSPCSLISCFGGL